MVQRDKRTTNENTVWLKRFAGWITKATDTHSEYVMLFDSPRQKLFACLV